MTERRIRAAAAALALAGAAVMSYLLLERGNGELLCTSGGCETVQSSDYADLLGVPVPAIGLLGFAGLLAAFLARGPLAQAAGLALALGALGFSAYLLVVQVVAIGALCDWCLVGDALVTALAVLALLRVRPRGSEPPLSRRMRAGRRARNRAPRARHAPRPSREP